MRIPVDQIPENGWARTLDIPLASLKRVVESHGPQTGVLHARVVLKNHRGCIDVRGEFSAELTLPCGVCLDEGTVKVAAPLEVMVAPQADWEAGHTDSFHEEVKLSPSDLDVSFYDGEELDLNQLLEDELLIAAPDRLSEEDAAGTCSYCGLEVDTVLRERQPEAEADAAAFHPFRELAQRLNEAPEKAQGAKKKDRKRKA